MVLWFHRSPEPERHLDRFSRICRAHHYCDRETDQHTTILVVIGRISLHTQYCYASQKSGQNNLTYDGIAAADRRLNRTHQEAPMRHPKWAHWRHLANTIELVFPSAHPSPQPKQQIERFSRLCTAYCRKSLLYNGRPCPPKIAHSHGGFEPPSSRWFPGASRILNPNGISIGLAVFALMTAECPYKLTLEPPLSPRIAPSHGRSGPPSSTWFPGATRVLNPNGISIGSAVFAGLTNVTDRQTETTLLGRSHVVLRCGVIIPSHSEPVSV